jgi:hypothetical protein
MVFGSCQGMSFPLHSYFFLALLLSYSDNIIGFRLLVPMKNRSLRIILSETNTGHSIPFPRRHTKHWGKHHGMKLHITMLVACKTLLQNLIQRPSNVISLLV